MEYHHDELIRKAQEGDAAALERLISENLGLVKSIALRFKDRGTEYEDLVQIGTIGMIRAVRSFDFSYNTAFSTYAVPLIIGEIRRHLRDDGIIKVSRSVKKQGVTILHEKERFLNTHGREPRLHELAEACGIGYGEVVYALEAVSHVYSLNDRSGEDDGTSLEGVIADKDNAIESLTDRIALSEAIATLPQLQQSIIRLRYYRELSQQQTGDILGLSQVKVSREEKKIMKKLREAL